MLWNISTRRLHGNVFVLIKVDAGVCCTEQFKLDTFITRTKNCEINFSTTLIIPLSPVRPIVVAVELSILGRLLPTVVDWCRVLRFVWSKMIINSFGEFAWRLLRWWWTKVVAIIGTSKSSRASSPTIIVAIKVTTVLITTSAVVVVIVEFTTIAMLARIIEVSITTTVIIESTIIIP